MASLQPSLALSRDSGILGKVALEKEEIPWRTLQMDNFMIRFGDQVHHFLLMLDEASGYAVTREFAVHSEDGDQNITAKTLEILQQTGFNTSVLLSGFAVIWRELSVGIFWNLFAKSAALN